MAEYLEYDWRMGILSSEFKQQLHVPKEEPTDKNSAVQAIKNLIQRCSDHELKNNLPQDDKTILKFLYARKFGIDETFRLMENYYRYRRNNPDIFKNFHLFAGDIRKALENGLPGVLESKDRKGRCVMIVNANNWDCTYGLISVYR